MAAMVRPSLFVFVLLSPLAVTARGDFLFAIHHHIIAHFCDSDFIQIVFNCRFLATLVTKRYFTLKYRKHFKPSITT